MSEAGDHFIPESSHPERPAPRSSLADLAFASFLTFCPAWLSWVLRTPPDPRPPPNPHAGLVLLAPGAGYLPLSERQPGCLEVPEFSSQSQPRETPEGQPPRHTWAQAASCLFPW